MKPILFLILILSCFGISRAQNGSEKISLEILPDSKLNITGDTNIRDFECIYNPALLPSYNELKFRKNGNSILFDNALLKLSTRGFDCGSRGINKDFHSLLKTSEYPEIHLELKKLQIESPEKAIAEMLISIAGKKKHYSVPVELVEGAISGYKGNLVLNIRDFDLEMPRKMLGLIVIKDDIEISFNLKVLAP